MANMYQPPGTGVLGGYSQTNRPPVYMFNNQTGESFIRPADAPEDGWIPVSNNGQQPAQNAAPGYQAVQPAPPQAAAPRVDPLSGYGSPGTVTKRGMAPPQAAPSPQAFTRSQPPMASKPMAGYTQPPTYSGRTPTSPPAGMRIPGQAPTIPSPGAAQPQTNPYNSGRMVKHGNQAGNAMPAQNAQPTADRMVTGYHQGAANSKAGQIPGPVTPQQVQRPSQAGAALPPGFTYQVNLSGQPATPPPMMRPQQQPAIRPSIQPRGVYDFPRQAQNLAAAQAVPAMSDLRAGAGMQGMSLSSPASQFAMGTAAGNQLAGAAVNPAAIGQRMGFADANNYLGGQVARDQEAQNWGGLGLQNLNRQLTNQNVLGANMLGLLGAGYRSL